MTATSATVMVIFSKMLFRKLLDQSHVKFLLNNYEAHLQHPAVEDFMDMGRDTC